MQNNHKQDKHIFALYYKALENKAVLVIIDKDFIARVMHVLRLVQNEHIILFNGAFVGEYSISALDKKMITLHMLSMNKVAVPQQKMHVCIGLLKKESFEEVLYNATELGITSIQPIITEKIHKNWWSPQYKERFEKIIIAACEQSKNFAIPDLYEPITFPSFVQTAQQYTNKLWFDVDGDAIGACMQKIDQRQDIYMLIGPEGDFSLAEKAILQQQQFNACRLTVTVLRSVQAVTVGVGAVASMSNVEQA